MNFLVIEKERFEQLETNILQIKEALNHKHEDDLSSAYIESKKVPKLLGISLKTWQTYRDKGIIPFIQFGSKIWVKRTDIDSFLEQHYIKRR
jgi:excisionase family DNA binding protein